MAYSRKIRIFRSAGDTKLLVESVPLGGVMFGLGDDVSLAVVDIAVVVVCCRYSWIRCYF